MALWGAMKGDLIEFQNKVYRHEFLHLFLFHPRIELSLLCCIETIVVSTVLNKIEAGTDASIANDSTL